MTLLDKASELYKMVLEAKPKNDPMVLQLQQYIVTHFGHEGTRAMADVEAGPLDYKYKSQSTGQGGGPRMRAFQHPLNQRPQQRPEREEIAADPAEQPNPVAALEAQYVDLGKMIAAEKDPATRRSLVTQAATVRTRINAITPATEKRPAGKTFNPLPASKPAHTAVKNDGAGNTTKSPALAAKNKQDAVRRAESAGKRERPSNSQTPMPDVAAGDAKTGGATETVAATNHPAPDPKVIAGMRAKALGAAYEPAVLQFWLTKMGVTMTGSESRTQLGQLVLQHIDKMATAFTDQPTV